MSEVRVSREAFYAVKEIDWHLTYVTMIGTCKRGHETKFRVYADTPMIASDVWQMGCPVCHPPPTESRGPL